ncbi:uncharacterized protein LOC115625413 [Scaptodrosophila lebanonensis]|uniref:Uncharacterized protein LOC115625413 n=1 Tax=Drosophila lebanonensis TaxID=7225 RepID=A0A6J2TMU1_DROLE|nr:uncharacterized protein LOC115625413 [Scaptodrosophila lebanonensis]
MRLSTFVRPVHCTNTSSGLLSPLSPLRPLFLLLSSLLLLSATCCVAHSADNNFDAVADALTAQALHTDNSNIQTFDMLPQQEQHYDNHTKDTYDNSSSNNHSKRALSRRKRYLEFPKGSRMSWRTNIRNNLLKINTLISYGYGFRANWGFPDLKEQRQKNRIFFKRDLFQNVETALNGHGFDGRACILKSYCTALLDVDNGHKSGMLFKMLKLVFSLDEQEKRHLPHLREENCQQILHSHCPLSFDSISPYTDDV